MAKVESTAVKKLKGKKRKHANGETEDEIANKSIIVETNAEDVPMQTNVETEQATSIRKSKKRKSKEKCEIVEKRSKLQQNDANDPTKEDHEVDEDFHEPSLEELKECEKSENKLAILTGRKKKKQKHEKLLESQKGQTVQREKQRNDEYLNKWKHARNSWKFEKLRQISIQQTMFDSEKLDGNIWPIALEYLAASKGSAKDKIVQLANIAIEEVDKLCELQRSDEEKQDIFGSIKYQRARDLLQLFD